MLYWYLKGLIYKNLQNAAEGGVITRHWGKHPPRSSVAPKCVNMVCTVTPTVIPPLAAYIGFWRFLLRTPFNQVWMEDVLKEFLFIWLATIIPIKYILIKYSASLDKAALILTLKWVDFVRNTVQYFASHFCLSNVNEQIYSVQEI